MKIVLVVYTPLDVALSLLLPSAAKPFTASTALSVLPNNEKIERNKREKLNVQSEDFRRISCLYAISLGFPLIALYPPQ